MTRFKHLFPTALILGLAVLTCQAQVSSNNPVLSIGHESGAQKAINNADVIALVGAGLPDSIVIAKIQAASLTSFDTSLDGLKSLKAANISDSVIRVMIDPHLAAAPVSPAASGLPTETGVYLIKLGSYTAIEAEVAKFRMGMLKMMATGGMLKTNVKGHVDGAHSATSVAAPIEFVIVLPDGVGLAEFQLVRLIEKSNYREFSTPAGGLLQSSNGVSRDAIKFEGRKIGPRTFAVTLPSGLTTGEYGFLPPRGALESNSVESTGKIYAFHITS